MQNPSRKYLWCQYNLDIYIIYTYTFYNLNIYICISICLSICGYKLFLSFSSLYFRKFHLCVFPNLAFSSSVFSRKLLFPLFISGIRFRNLSFPKAYFRNLSFSSLYFWKFPRCVFPNLTFSSSVFCLFSEFASGIYPLQKRISGIFLLQKCRFGSVLFFSFISELSLACISGIYLSGIHIPEKMAWTWNLSNYRPLLKNPEKMFL